MRVTVTVRPWTQNRTTAIVSLNKRATLAPYVAGQPDDVRPQAGLAHGQAQHGAHDRGRLAVRRHPGLRQAEEAEGQRNNIIPQWDLVGRLRLHPKTKRPNLRVGATDVVGRGNGRSLILAVRNIGNTLDPVGGTVRITGPTGRNATIPQVGIVPGQVVYLKGGGLSGMKGGNYTATWTVTHGGKRFTAKRTFKL